MRFCPNRAPVLGGFMDYRVENANVELLTFPISLILKTIIIATPYPSLAQGLKLGMNTERGDIYRSASRVIGWVINVLKVHTQEHVLH